MLREHADRLNIERLDLLMEGTYQPISEEEDLRGARVLPKELQQTQTLYYAQATSVPCLPALARKQKSPSMSPECLRCLPPSTQANQTNNNPDHHHRGPEVLLTPNPPPPTRESFTLQLRLRRHQLRRSHHNHQIKRKAPDQMVTTKLVHQLASHQPIPRPNGSVRH